MEKQMKSCGLLFRNHGRKSSVWGFTILEMLVVVAIIAIIATALIANYRQGQRNYDLEETTQKLAADIRNAQAMALGGAIPVANETGIKGFGIYIKDEHHYIIFYNKTNDTTYVTGSITIGSPMAITSNIFMSPTDISIFFSPPYISPFNSTYLSGGDPTEINLTKPEGGLSQKVKIYKIGKIEVSSQ